jgi:Ca-activated chloride channel family protein
MINYFTYDYREPEGDKPFAIDLDAAACPWDSTHRLLRVGLKGRDLPIEPKEPGEPVSGGTAKIAKDVNVQVEFNPLRVGSYRLIGYEKRTALPDPKPEEVNGDQVAAGSMVTALYEIVPAGIGATNSAGPGVDSLKYQRPSSAAKSTMPANDELSREMVTVQLHYKRPNSEVNETIEQPFIDNGSKFQDATPDLKFVAAVAEFGMILRDSPYKGTGTLKAVVEWAQEGKGRDAGGHRSGFIELVRKAEGLRQGEG